MNCPWLTNHRQENPTACFKAPPWLVSEDNENIFPNISNPQGEKILSIYKDYLKIFTTTESLDQLFNSLTCPSGGTWWETSRHPVIPPCMCPGNVTWSSGGHGVIGTFWNKRQAIGAEKLQIRLSGQMALQASKLMADGSESLDTAKENSGKLMRYVRMLETITPLFWSLCFKWGSGQLLLTQKSTQSHKEKVVWFPSKRKPSGEFLSTK